MPACPKFQLWMHLARAETLLRAGDQGRFGRLPLEMRRVPPRDAPERRGRHAQSVASGRSHDRTSNKINQSHCRFADARFIGSEAESDLDWMRKNRGKASVRTRSQFSDAGLSHKPWDDGTATGRLHPVRHPGYSAGQNGTTDEIAKAPRASDHHKLRTHRICTFHLLVTGFTWRYKKSARSSRSRRPCCTILSAISIRYAKQSE